MKKVRVSTLREKKESGEKIVAVTAHDALTASAIQAAGADVILVGDSLGMTALGFPSTLNVTLDMMLHHCSAVARGASLPLLIGDMPFMTYKVTPEQALTNAGRMIQEGGMEAVKIEGGSEMTPVIEKLSEAGLPIMAHIGLLPQSVHAQGGFRVQGRKRKDADRLVRDAKAVQQAGAFCVVLEGMPSAIARRITESLRIPTIGIGAGKGCDGQILVVSDLLGMSGKRLPKFAKNYANLFDASVKALESYGIEVRAGKFPGPEHVYDKP